MKLLDGRCIDDFLVKPFSNYFKKSIKVLDLMCGSWDNLNDVYPLINNAFSIDEYVGVDAGGDYFSINEIIINAKEKAKSFPKIKFIHDNIVNLNKSFNDYFDLVINFRPNVFVLLYNCTNNGWYSDCVDKSVNCPYLLYARVNELLKKDGLFFGYNDGATKDHYEIDQLNKYIDFAGFKNLNIKQNPNWGWVITAFK